MRSRLTLESLDARIVPATYFVSPTGDNGNLGTSASPWRTLQFAADEAGAGDQVIVRAGNYAGFHVTTDGSFGSPITFSAESGVNITSPNPSSPHAGSDGINIEGADYVTIEGFNITGMPRAGIRVVGNIGSIIRNNNSNLNGVWGIFTGFAESVRIENNITSNSVREHGIYVSNSADNPIVRGNTSFGNRACGIHMNSDVSSGGDGIISNALIENNTIYNNGVGGGSAINMDGVSNSVVRNNLIYGNHATGIALYQIDGAHGARDNLIVNNTVRVASDGRWALLIVNASTGNTAFNNILLNDGGYRGSISISPDSLLGFVSDYNVVMDRFTTNDGDSITPLAAWRATGLDTHSLIAMPTALFDANYRLIETSPALNVGTNALNNSSAPPADLMGTARPSGGGFDIGAHERLAATPSAPRVESVAFNGTQRSLIRSITVTFDTRVTFDSGAFSLRKGNGANPTKTLQFSEQNGKTVVTITFHGTGTTKASLNDGNWTLKVLAARVHRVDAPAMTMAADSVTRFHRYFGDADGDRDVDAADRLAFDAAFGQVNNLATFDYDNDGDVDAKDRAQFNKRFGRRI